MDYTTRMLDAIFPLDPQILVSAIVVLVVVHVILGTVGMCTYLERKISAYIQDRVGPNRAGFDFGLPFLKELFSFGGSKPFGFWGLGQFLADGIKFIVKEDYRPRGADKVLFTLAPMAAVIPALVGWAVIPWGGTIDVPEMSFAGVTWFTAGTASVTVADINIGFLFLLAVAGVGVYGVTLGGWASNNKYSFLGGLRCSAGMVSYEIPMGLALLMVVLTAGSVYPSAIVENQVANGWYVFAHPLAALIFFICALAESNRTPFDNAECEQELVGGFHTEYCAMRFALFFLAEYAHLIVGSAFLVLLFLGGYHLPFVPWLSPESTGILAALAKFTVFFTKAMLIVMLAMLVRWTIPRLRYDQMMKVCWNALIPTMIVLVVSMAIVMFLGLVSLPVLLLMNVGVAIGGALLLPMLPKQDVNRRIPMAGSRFNPLPGEQVSAAPTDPVALDERGLADGPKLVG